MRHNLIKDYYIPGVKHVCRFCGTPLKKLRDGKLVPLSNQAHCSLLSDRGHYHVFNGCKDCIRKIKFSKYKYLMQQIFEEDLDLSKEIALKHGESKKQATRDRELWRGVKILKGFHSKNVDNTDDTEKVRKEADRFIKREQKNAK